MMAVHEFGVSIELLVDICKEGARVTWPNQDDYAVCNRGFSPKARWVSARIVEGAIFITVDDPDTESFGPIGSPTWERRRGDYENPLGK